MVHIYKNINSEGLVDTSQCDLMEWKKSGYEDKDAIRRKFANLSKMAYLSKNDRIRKLFD